MTEILKLAEEKMNKTMNALDRDFSAVRAGRLAAGYCFLRAGRLPAYQGGVWAFNGFGRGLHFAS